jgi:lipid-A-disaccharide synthase
VRILLSAAEASSDTHGAKLLEALKAESPGLEAFGIGGPRLREAGLETVVDARDLLSMGLTEIMGRLPRILAALDRVAAEAQARKPDLAIVMDYPEFHMKLAARLRKLGIPVVYYIPPKLWVWREGRLKRLRALCEKLLCILPFEEKFYASRGAPASYVGNPLVDELPLTMTREQAREALSVGNSDLVLALLPGSRPAELKRHIDVMLDGATRAAARLRVGGKLRARDPLRVLIPIPETSNVPRIRAQIESWVTQASGGEPGFILDVRVFEGNAAACLAAADAALVKSGTATLEAGLMLCPHAVVYKPSALTGWAFRNVVRYKGPVGLVNLVAGGGPEARPPYLVNEIVMNSVTARNLENELVSLFGDEARRRRIVEGLGAMKARVLEGAAKQSPSLRAAKEALSALESYRARSGGATPAPGPLA